MFCDSLDSITGDGTTNQPRESRSIKDLETTNPPAKTSRANEIRFEGKKELPTPGDVVLVMNNKTTKDSWPIARVTKVYKSNDGVIRSVELRPPINVTTKEKLQSLQKEVHQNQPLFMSIRIHDLRHELLSTLQL